VFALSWRGAVEIPPWLGGQIDPKAGLLAISRELSRCGARVGPVSAARLEFVSSPMLLQSRTAMLVLIDYGSVEARTDQGRAVMSYRLSFGRRLVLLMVFGGCLVLLGDGRVADPWWLAGAFALGITAICAVSILRFRSIIVRSMDGSAVETQGQTA
jgi:hypothetical protein